MKNCDADAEKQRVEMDRLHLLAEAAKLADATQQFERTTPQYAKEIADEAIAVVDRCPKPCNSMCSTCKQAMRRLRAEQSTMEAAEDVGGTVMFQSNCGSEAF